ncbi:penicillin-binding transpeptidase domain-containing protein [Streptomyces spongiicola]|uniref:penicillin-binding transpeptidase domain-containing protein n=1 Tax=Streptomyces spongiicola TaxID=1690221 RepID=UPI0033CC9B4A
MRFGTRAAIFGLSVIAAIGIGGYGMASLVLDDDVPEAAEEFFDAWADGDLEKAARLTTDPDAALIALKAYKDRTHLTSVELTARNVDGQHVPFTVTAHIAAQGAKATWAYDSALDVRANTSLGERVVWEPAIVHPELGDREGYTVEVVPTAPPVTVVDRHGEVLDPQEKSPLSRIVRQLQDRYALKTGTPSLDVRLAPLSGESEDGATVTHLLKGRAATIRTTIDPAVQRSAEAAVADRPGASAIAIQPSTGEVLAVASPVTSEMNPALEGVEAPGSVFEIVTAAALLEGRAVTPSSPVACPDTAVVAGTRFTNPKLSSAAEGGTFRDIFASTCDTGFVGLADKLAPRALSDTAKDVFGLGLDWQTGVTTADGSVPELSGADKAAAAIGRGEVRLNVLNLASITATVKDGTFKQPLFVNAKVIGSTRAKAQRSLPGPITQQLRDMMRLNATHGTGAQSMTGLSGTFGSMAGVAEQGPGQGNHVWFTAFRGDLAVAAVTGDNGQGVAAGDITRAILDAHR